MSTPDPRSPVFDGGPVMSTGTRALNAVRHAATDPACPERTPDSLTSENVATIDCVACLRRMVTGLVRAERENPYRPSFGEPVAPWFRGFAWRPVDTVDRGKRWLCPVWKRRIQKHQYLDGGADFWWQYARERP